MLIDHSAFEHGDPYRWHDLPGDEALLLWSLRRLVVAWPRCHAVPAALHRRWPESSLGIEHLLRCFLTSLGRHARRPITIGDPNCAALLPDEAAILAVLHDAGDPDRHGIAVAALATLSDGGECGLLVLAAALAAQLAAPR